MKYMLVLLMLSLGSCSANKVDSIESNIKLTPRLTASRFSDIYFSAQPDENDFRVFQKNKVKTVLNLRLQDEKDYKASDEKSILNKLGIGYVHIPTTLDSLMQIEKVNAITAALVKARKKGAVLVHCESGNRAAFWAGVHFYKDHKLSKTKAHNYAVSLGLNNGEVSDSLRSHLNSRP